MSESAAATESAPRLAFTHLDDVPWQEVRVIERDGRRVSCWEKYLEFSPNMLVIWARYDPGMCIHRHGHNSHHTVFVLEGSIRVGERDCPAGTSIVLEHGAAFGPIEAGPDGALMHEIMMGDPRSWPADPPEVFEAFLAARNAKKLPNPPLIEAPSWFVDTRTS